MDYVLMLMKPYMTKAEIGALIDYQLPERIPPVNEQHPKPHG